MPRRHTKTEWEKFWGGGACDYYSTLSHLVNTFADIAHAIFAQMDIECQINEYDYVALKPQYGNGLGIEICRWRVICDGYLRVSPRRREFIQRLSDLCGEYETCIAEIKNLPQPIAEEIAQEFTWRQRVRKLLNPKL